MVADPPTCGRLLCATGRCRIISTPQSLRLPGEFVLSRSATRSILCALSAFLVASCGGGAPAGPASITLASVVDSATFVDSPDIEEAEAIRWDFAEGAAPEGAEGESFGANALMGVAGLEVRDGALRGRTTSGPALVHVPVPEGVELKGTMHRVEIRMQVAAGEVMGLDFSGAPELDRDEQLEDLAGEDASYPPIFSADLEPGDEMQTYTLTTAGTMISSLEMGALRQLMIKPTDVEGVEFAIESIALVSLEEHLGSIPSGVSWQGLGEIYRETLVTRTPEAVSFEIDVPANAWLDLTIGMIEPGVATFAAHLESGGESTQLLRRTVTTPNRWEPVPIDLAPWAGRSVTLRLEGEAESDGRLLYWGGPVVRVRGDALRVGRATEARTALSDNLQPPKRILFILADTLRRDRLAMYGGERDNAPVLSRLADEGMVFTKNVSQGTWTKVSVPSILTSLYPTSHGLVDIPDRLPSSVTTLAEAVREAGYATYATSSVPFTGKLTNLHQGVETLSERSSIGDLGHSEAKTARTYVDRLLPWIETHAETPFFVFLHVFDPHSPFEPYPPYDTLYTDDGELEAHRERIEAVQEVIENDHMRGDVMPTTEELAEAGVDADAFVDTEYDWYDASILAMDAEIGRVLERLEELEILDDTLIVFMSDHGEEFLEHGRHFHGWNAYGEMLNVPLMMWWPGVIPAGRSDEVVESINVYPTVADLARLPVPSYAQGQSMVPLMIEGEAPSRFGWVSRPAFAERTAETTMDSPVPKDEEVNSLVIVADGWKLIKNTMRPDDWPEFELYDYDADPMDQNDLAADNPEVVERLAAELDAWHERALAAKIEEADTADLSPEELSRLRALGYIQ
jgi:arylsulfatase A-like enzyme